MYRLVSNQALYQSWVFEIYNMLRRWVRREVIDFAPYDEEAVKAQQLLEQFNRAEFRSNGFFCSQGGVQKT